MNGRTSFPQSPYLDIAGELARVHIVTVTTAESRFTGIRGRETGAGVKIDRWNRIWNSFLQRDIRT